MCNQLNLGLTDKKLSSSSRVRSVNCQHKRDTCPERTPTMHCMTGHGTLTCHWADVRAYRLVHATEECLAKLSDSPWAQRSHRLSMFCRSLRHKSSVVPSIVCKSFPIFLMFSILLTFAIFSTCVIYSPYWWYPFTFLTISVHLLVTSVHLFDDIRSPFLRYLFIFWWHLSIFSCYPFTSDVFHSPYILTRSTHVWFSRREGLRKLSDNSWAPRSHRLNTFVDYPDTGGLTV